MNFNSFIKSCKEQWVNFEDTHRLASSLHPFDRHLAELPTQISGMATENKLMLLNLAVAQLVEGEVYVEIGCWRGLSLIGATRGNSDVSVFACDNFSQFGGPRDELIKNIEHFTCPGKIHLYDMDYLNFIKLAPWQPSRIGVYFYDGGHSFAEQFQAIQYIVPWLSQDAIVIVDDTNEPRVRAANRLISQYLPGLQLIADLRTPQNGSATWWNGLQIYRYQSTSCISPPSLQSSYFIQQFFWDNIALPFQRLLHECRVIAGKTAGLRSVYHLLKHVVLKK